MDEEKLKSIRDEYLTRSDKVDYSLDLPEAETDVMLALWRGEGPYNTSKVMKLIGEHKGWKPSTLISFLSRLEEKGFIMSYKDGKERFYIPLAEKFVSKYHGNSISSLLDSVYSDRDFSDDDIDELIAWLETRRVR